MDISDYENITIEQLEKMLTKKERKFIEELEIDENGALAAIRAGLLDGRDRKDAASAAKRVLRKPKVLAYRLLRANEAYELLGISPESILMKLQTVYNRSMQAEPVLEWDKEEREWRQTGEWQFDARSALKALELMGKSQGMFVDKVINDNRNLTLEEYLKKLEAPQSERAGLDESD